MAWYAIRTVYHFGKKADGTNVFEERVVCFQAESADAAHTLAVAESEQYEKENNVVAHPEQSGYQQDGETLVNGYELWSELFESQENLQAFYEARYGRYEYKPEPPDA